MKILLLAYEFPPSPSPQSLRWAYLSSRLVQAGHEVHVLAPDIAPYGPGGLPPLPPGLAVHRTVAGVVHGLVAVLAERRRERADGSPTGPAGLADSAADAGAPATTLPPRLNWKGRLVSWLRSVSAPLWFPDERGQWRIWARRRMYALLDELQPDLVVCSHEPAVTLELGLAAAARGVRWAADLGDPVLAPYTPWRWRRRARALEAKVWRRADLVTVTNDVTADLLERRHGRPGGQVLVLPQGFDDALAPATAEPDWQGQLELLFTGRFYPFRPAGPLLAAVAATPGVRLSVATDCAPPELEEAARAQPEKFRVLGFLSHAQALEEQRRAHVLVNVGNALPAQIPGKLYEYLGAGRPLLHLVSGERDPVPAWLQLLGRGFSCANREQDIAAALRNLHDLAAEGRMSASFRLGREAVAEFGWSRLAASAAAAFHAAAGKGTGKEQGWQEPGDRHTVQLQKGKQEQ